MAFCTKCGAPMDDGAAFCSACGQGAGQTVAPTGASAIRAFTLTNNTLILALIGCLGANILFTFISNLAADAGFLGALFACVLPGLIVAGIAMAWAQGSKVGDYPTAGFTMIKVVNIINIVVMSIASFFCFLCGFLMSAMDDFLEDILEMLADTVPDFEDMFIELVEELDIYDYEVFQAIFTITFFIMGIVFIAAIFLFYVPTLKTCSALKTLVTKGAGVKFSGLLKGMLWFAGVVSVFGIFTTDVLALFTNLFAAGAYICAALLYTKATKELSC